jgi:excisionase family DNA binding protein
VGFPACRQAGVSYLLINMAEEKLLTIREVGIILGISEKEVIDLAESGAIPAYKVGGVYLRFKREQIEEFRKSFKHPTHKSTPFSKHAFKDRMLDFFYFNDFYILSVILIILIIVIIFRGY